MGLMFASRRASAKKQHEANKQKAHAENHERVKAEQQQIKEKTDKKDGADKPAAK